MKAHLTEQELIEYQFKLASDVQVGEIAGHLEDCSQCREHLEKLQHKFSALDLLREEITVSEDLISRVVEQAGSARGGVRTKFIRFRKPAWLSAAAAVLLVGTFLLVANLNKDKEAVPGIATDSGRTQPVDKMELRRKSERELTEDLYEKAPIETKIYSPVAKHGERISQVLSDIKTDGIVGGEISERPPFAPASAIELVVLPRRDKVQLTIYNSADLTLVREQRNLTLKKGWNWMQFMWANTLIDPTSLSLEPLAQADKIDIQQLVFPARLRELGRWLIRSEVSGQVPFEITYFTSGLNWRAFYMGTLAEDEKTMQLQGYVRVGNNSGEDYEKAQTRLIVGKVHILDQIAELA
ncbi:MAG: anti-sigma factor family protein, partial [Planctomycetota bacterium]